MSENIRSYGQKLSYGEALQKQLTQLHISQEELALALGVTPKTIGRYVQDITRPNKEKRQAIALFIADKSSFGAYEYMPPEKFVPLLNSLLAEFKGEVSQRMLADAIGKYQKNISNYTCLSDPDKPDTKTQFCILNFFHARCSQNGLLNGGHFDTAVKLERLLYGERGAYACFLEQFRDVFGITDDKGPFYAYALSLPTRLRNLILEYFDIFFDDLTHLHSHEPIVHTMHHTLSDGIRLFRQLTKEQQELMVAKLEEDTFIGYPKGGFGVPETSPGALIYSRLEGFYKIIQMDLPKMRSREATPAPDRQTEAEYIKKIENVLTYYSDRMLMQEGIIQEIEFKLTLSSYEWYISMLMYIYHYKNKDLETLYKEMRCMIGPDAMTEEDLMECIIESHYMQMLEKEIDREEDEPS